MGVDARLYLKPMGPTFIAYAFARAAGEETNDNIHSGSRFLKATSVAGMFHIDLKEATPTMFCVTEGPTGPATMIMARSRPEIIALFEAVADVLGGVVVYNDYDDLSRTYINPRAEEEDYVTLETALRNMPKAEVKAEHKELSAY